MTNKEKTEITRKNVIDSAIEMFGEKGYEGFIVNEFCKKYNFSKGKLYHNFTGKDNIYIEAVKYCFSEMVNYLKKMEEITDVQTYMEIRMKFFLQNRTYEKLFFEVMTNPPVNLLKEKTEIKANLWKFNKKIFSKIISKAKLRKDLTEKEMLDYFELIQEVFNRHFTMLSKDIKDFETLGKLYEEKVEKLIDCILHGITEH